MSKGYWNGQVFEIKNEEKWNNYLAKYFEIEKNHLDNNNGNFVPIFAGQPKEKIQGANLMFAALVELIVYKTLLITIKVKNIKVRLLNLEKNLKKV